MRASASAAPARSMASSSCAGFTSCAKLCSALRCGSDPSIRALDECRAAWQIRHWVEPARRMHLQIRLVSRL